MSESSTSLDHGETEEWRPVVGWEGLYDVSSLGRMRSLDREVEVEMPYGRTVRHYRGKMLNPYVGPSTRGYLTVALSRQGESQKTKQVHQFVARAFLGPCPIGQEVRHGPNGKLDNRASQLSYGTRLENFADRVRDHGTIRGERAGMAKLTWATVVEIRRRAAAGEQQRRLATEFGVCFQNIHLIVARKTWLYPPEEW